MTGIDNALRSIRPGDKVKRDTATCNRGRVQLGDAAPAFAPLSPRSGEKIERNIATRNEMKVQLGDAAPIFGR